MAEPTRTTDRAGGPGPARERRRADRHPADAPPGADDRDLPLAPARPAPRDGRCPDVCRS